MEFELNHLPNQIALWQNINKRDELLDQQQLLNAIRVLDQQEDTDPSYINELRGKIILLLAEDRRLKSGEDHLYQLLVSFAMEALPNDPDLISRSTQNFIVQYAELLSGLQIPVLRETDNRTAKRNISIKMRTEAIAYYDKVKMVLTETNSFIDKEGDEKRLSQLEKMQSLLRNIVDKLKNVIEASTEFEASLAGAFYTVTTFENLKMAITDLDTLIQNWHTFYVETVKTDISQQKSALEELSQMIGLLDLKKRVNKHYAFLQYQKKRNQLGFQTKEDMSMNMVLTGNPGTGKTTLARLLAKIYHELGILPMENVIEADRARLVGAFVGQTEENVRKIVEQAVGGILFIDEAYTLTRGDQKQSDYGQTAIDTLVSLMSSQQYAGKFAVILAGYPEEMRLFLDANPGLRSRFPQFNHFHLPDYTLEELKQIAILAAEQNDYFIDAAAFPEIENRLEREMVDQTFGNARTARAIVTDAIFKKGSNGSTQQANGFYSFAVLTKEDFLLNEPIVQTNPVLALEQLIGLHDIKLEMKKLSSFVKMQQVRRDAGYPVVPIQLHAVFTGNPGTGKTTVAKLYSEILKECGMLKRGHLIVAGRGDFVAGYVGQTALKTKKKIREALGGVLFIDEAYSLLSESDGDYGKEVVNTLVEEMTKHNENLVIVLAGYPNEIKNLLESNPGFTSRFKKFFHFPDYSVEELIDIMEAYAAMYQYHLSTDAKHFLETVLPESETKGNGRFATNMINDAIQMQAKRMMDPGGKIDLTQVTMLTKEDFTELL